MTRTPADTRAPAQHLDSEALSQLRALLVSARTAQEVGAEAHVATVTELTGEIDADSLVERELADASANRAREALADIDGALARIDDGTYGWCESCSQPIAVERLEVIPQARLCVACSRESGAGVLGLRSRAAAASNR